MPAAALPSHEFTRLAVLESLGLLDTAPEDDYDDIVRIAAALCGTPMAMITLVDARRQWFKARQGMAAPETPRDVSFCAHAILEPDDALVVPDATHDARFADSPLVTGGDIRFYAGVPLIAGGMPVGTVCVADGAPRELDDAAIEALHALARQAGRLMEMRRLARMLDVQRREREWIEGELTRVHGRIRAEDPDGWMRFDPFTGLPGTRAFLESLDADLKHEGTLQLALVELDARDEIENLHGALERDRTLRALVRSLRELVHGPLARVGDAFAVRLSMPASQARAQCEALRAHVASGAVAGFPTHVSIGLAGSRGGDDANDLFQRASAALAEARVAGDVVVVYPDANAA